MEKALNSLFLYSLILLGLFSGQVTGQAIFSTDSYPDEKGYQDRISGELKGLASSPTLFRSQPSARCPDTGIKFKTWALEGEIIFSPFTGRAFLQGPTGYFGPKKRDENGEISYFGGDALKKDLLPITAKLLLQLNDSLLRGFLSIPGNLQQQYHFAAKNWARFYPLLADEMGPAWKSEFQKAVATYSASNRPSDGYRKYDPLSTPHNLVGEPDELLGGNKKDGGTENHKIMWRSSAWVYAAHFPDTALISGWPVSEVKTLSERYFSDFYERLLKTGNGEYDSEIYYPHSIEGLLNLYDFAESESARVWSKAILDYLLATIAFKSYDGALAGAQKRGPSLMNSGGELNKMFHFWFGSPDLDPDHPASLHQITSSYRPSKYIWDLFHKSFPLPFEVKVSRPSYHMDQANHAQEYFYGSKNFGLGSIYLTQLDNPNQQVQWSLVIKTAKGPKTLGGSQPFHRSPGGHSPYTQTAQHKNVIVVAAAATEVPGEETKMSGNPRLNLAQKPLNFLAAPTSTGQIELEKWFAEAKQQEATWLFIPKGLGKIHEIKNKILIENSEAYLCISPFSSDHYWVEAGADSNFPKGKAKVLADYKLLVVNGSFSGYCIEIVESDSYASFSEFKDSINANSRLEVDIITRKVTHTSLALDTLHMEYQSTALRAKVKINGAVIGFDKWSPSGVYTSVPLKVGEGVFKGDVNGEIFSIRVNNNKPSYD
jgi:hypothetical protein